MHISFSILYRKEKVSYDIFISLQGLASGCTTEPLINTEVQIIDHTPGHLVVIVNICHWIQLL